MPSGRGAWAGERKWECGEHLRKKFGSGRETLGAALATSATSVMRSDGVAEPWVPAAARGPGSAPRAVRAGRPGAPGASSQLPPPRVDAAARARLRRPARPDTRARPRRVGSFSLNNSKGALDQGGELIGFFLIPAALARRREGLRPLRPGRGAHRPLRAPTSCDLPHGHRLHGRRRRARLPPDEDRASRSDRERCSLPGRSRSPSSSLPAGRRAAVRRTTAAYPRTR